MDILLVETDHLVRDQVKVGLQQFPEFSITCGEGYSGLNLLRQKRFGVVFLGLANNHRDAQRLVEHMRSIDRGVDLVVMATDRIAKDMAGEKARFNIWSFLTTPVQVHEFFRLLSRIRERLEDSEPATASRGSSSHHRAVR